MSEKQTAKATERYEPPAPDGNGVAGSVKKLTDNEPYLVVLQEFTCGGYRHLPGIVLDPAVFRQYAPKNAEVDRAANGYLKLVIGKDGVGEAHQELERQRIVATGGNPSTVAVP